MRKTLTGFMLLVLSGLQLFAINLSIQDRKEIMPMRYSTFGGFRVAGRLFNRPMTFMLDMGANANFVSSRYTNHVATPYFFKGNGPGSAIANIAPFTIHNRMQYCKFYFLDLTRIPLDDVNRLDAVVGQLFFRNYRTYFDFAQNRIAFLSPGTVSLEKLATPGKRYSVIPLTQEQNIIVIPVTIQGRTFRLQIDTGMLNSDIILYNSTKLRQSGLIGDMTKNKSAYETKRGDISGKLKTSLNYSCKDLKIGSMTETGISVTVDKDGSDDPYCEGVIGVRLLQRFNIVFDFKEGKALFEQHGQDVSGHNLYPVGATIIKNRDGRILILSVKPGSDIQRAGIKPGDELVMIGPLQARMLGYIEASKALYSKLGTAIELTIKNRQGTRQYRFMPLK